MQYCSTRHLTLVHIKQYNRKHMLNIKHSIGLDIEICYCVVLSQTKPDRSKANFVVFWQSAHCLQCE